MVMTVTVEKITPAKAERFLNRNCDNRMLRTGLVEKYASDMKNGNWTNCTDPIALYENGDVADGQHRLWAVIESGEPQQFIVARGLSKADGLNIDVGLNRTFVDNARISGLHMDLSNRLVAVCRAISYGNRGSSRAVAMSNAQKVAMVEKYGEAARWAVDNGPRGRAFSHALVLGAMARAWYYEEDRARLAKFGEVLAKGFMADDTESAAIAMRNHLLASAQTGFTHEVVWRDMFLKVQNAIRNFMRKRKITVIKSVSEEMYPLPKERKVTERKAA